MYFKTIGAIKNLLFKAVLFHFKNAFEHEFFIEPPLTGKDLKDIETRHGGSLYKWASTLQYVVHITCTDLGYATVRLSGYMTVPNKPIFDALHQCMTCLYHHPHKPIIYPRKTFNKLQPKLEVHNRNVQAEYLQQYKSFITIYSDVDLARELRERRSTTSIDLLTNGVATHLDIFNQGEPTGATTNVEIFALHKGIIKASDIRNFSSSIGCSIGDPSSVHKDNIGTVKAITSDCTTPTYRHHDV
eukprot:7107357-Ditylum_brightwellii.AAC.1